MDDDIKNSILRSGTTILGVMCKDGVVMAADRQVTMGHSIVGHKDYPKVVQLNDYLVISGCGIVSDMQRISKIFGAELKLKELRSKSRPTVKQAANLLGSMSYTGLRSPSMVPQQVAFLVAGFNEDGPIELFSVGVDGTVYAIKDYDASIGSGMPFVLGLLERQYKKGLSVKEGVELAQEALKSSTQRDTGSGYGIDVFTITKEGIRKAVEQEILPEYKDVAR